MRILSLHSFSQSVSSGELESISKVFRSILLCIHVTHSVFFLITLSNYKGVQYFAISVSHTQMLARQGNLLCF